MNDEIRIELQIGQQSPESIRLRQLMKERAIRADDREPRTVEEWRVTGEPGKGYPSYRFTFSSDRYEHPEAAARGFVESVSDWVDGPHLDHRTIAYWAWERE